MGKGTCIGKFTPKKFNTKGILACPLHTNEQAIARGAANAIRMYLSSSRQTWEEKAPAQSCEEQFLHLTKLTSSQHN